MRKVLHIDMDAFYASVEQRDDPALRGRPVVVAWKGPRSVVCAASYEARRFGIHSAMPALRAERLCPQAIFVAPDFDRYKQVSRQIRDIFHRHTDLVEPLSLDEAYLDVTHNKQGLTSATAVAIAIRAAIREETALTASAGVASNKFLAKIASDWRKPDGIHIIRPEQVAAFLSELPVGRLPGVGKVMEARLAELALERVGQLRALAPGVLEQRFGRWGRRLQQLALGIDDSPVRPSRRPQQISCEDTFPLDLPLEALLQPLHTLVERLWANAQRKSLAQAHTIVLKLKTAQFVNLSRSITLPQPPPSAAVLMQAVQQLLTRVELPATTRYRLAGVGLSGFRDGSPDRRQGELFSAGESS